MSAEIKSGEEIVNEFFSGLSSAEDLDADTVSCIVDLFNSGKLSDRNITNGLADLRNPDNDED